MWHSELPAHLGDAFTVARARKSGVSSGRLQAKHLEAPFHGTRATRTLDDIAALQLLFEVLPSHAFACGATAASLQGMPLPAAIELVALKRPTIGVPLPHNRIRRPQVAGRALAVSDDTLTEVRGIRCTTLARTWVDLGAVLPLPRFVAVTDHLIARRGGRASVQSLRDAHVAAGAGRGSRIRAEGLALCSDGAESPRESETRTLLVLGGLPVPETNVDIFSDTRFVARVDMLYRAERLIVEYDGEYHQTDAQWRKDQARRAELISLGYRLVVVTSSDIDDPRTLVARVRRLLLA
ncbi:endonuclease domain-containing protein [Microbacterium sp. CFBP9034]|uniref:endonuclease domain-containing protein n=1 Tax=Microbacterium sp. CFBP9034 TaxID=3096540 RepID=UPI002A6B0662|nr:DUF559 domain-containing protein [Microbacterium sp. CFBP9034]MDY0908870.1 DUF559 domain-containing protein [Microbacterium sp. CFBP9034]